MLEIICDVRVDWYEIGFVGRYGIMDFSHSSYALVSSLTSPNACLGIDKEDDLSGNNSPLRGMSTSPSITYSPEGSENKGPGAGEPR